MINRQAIRNFVPAILVFIFLNTGFLFFSEKLQSRGFDINVLVGGTLILFITTLVSYLMSVQAVHTKNNQAFFRLVYGSFIFKLIFLAAAAFIYIMIMKKDVNKPAIYFCMGLYVLFTVLEVRTLLKISKQKSNG
jgi:Ca2+/Na+ antiporter